MKLFVNDIPVRIKSAKAIAKGRFDAVLNGKESLRQVDLKGKTLVWNSTTKVLLESIDKFTKTKPQNLKSVTFAFENDLQAIEYLKKHVAIVKAAGGIVTKNSLILLIYRLKKWDLPKGKLEKGEGRKEGAIREVEEETGVKVKLEKKIVSTWHTYIRKDRLVLKKTYWYTMICVDDSSLKPQYDEDIEKAVWMSEDKVDSAMKNSYKTIKEVIKRFRKL